MDFTAAVSGIDASKVGYKWTVSEGTIVKGQGTPRILVSTKGLYDTAIKVTVEFLNLPEGCPNTASETGIAACRCVSVQIDEFGKLSVKDEKERISAAILKAEKEDIIYIIHYSPNENENLKARSERIKKIFMENKTFEERFTIMFGGEEREERTKIYLVPPGADAPTP